MTILTADDLFTVEKMRGAVASVVAGSTGLGLNYWGMASLGLNPALSAAIFMYTVGSILGYSLDIVFAKHAFGADGHIPYSHVGHRFKWLIRSFASNMFFRFIIVFLIEVLTGIVMLEALITYMDSQQFMLDRPHLRNALAAVFIAFINFVLYANILRFDWAYNDVQSNQTLNVVVLMWMGIVLVLFSK